MDATRFVESPFGGPAREPGSKRAFTYYLPKPMPRDLALSTTIVSALSEADASLGLLQGLGVFITDPSLLIGPYLRREALASSRIEGTQASLSDVLQAEIDVEAQNDDTAEVAQYLRATHLAYELVQSLPITQRLMLDVHRTLLSGVRGQERLPGELRSSPVWVGPPGATLETAVAVSGHVVRAPRHQQLDGVHKRAAGGEHRIQHKDGPPAQILRQRLQVGHRFEGLLVASQAHQPQIGLRQHRLGLVDHAQQVVDGPGADHGPVGLQQRPQREHADVVQAQPGDLVQVAGTPAEVVGGGSDHDRGVGDTSGDHDVRTSVETFDDAEGTEVGVGAEGVRKSRA